jgi:mRNA interferase RelE/StbE
VTYRVELTRRARRDLSEQLPEALAAACWEFIRGPLAANPHRVGKPLRQDLGGLFSARRGEFRVIYKIFDQRIVVGVVTVQHRRDVYR